MSENDDMQATGGDQATSARPRPAEISGNARGTHGQTGLTHLMKDGSILDYGEDSIVGPTDPRLRGGREQKFSSTAISSETKRKSWDGSTKRAILTAQNAEYDQIVHWRNVTFCRDRDLQDEAHRLRRKAHSLFASEDNTREFKRFVEKNGLIFNHNQGECREWLIPKPRFWIIDSIFGSTAVVRPIYTSQGNGHLHKSGVGEYVSIKHPWHRNAYRQQSTYPPLTTDWWEWKVPLEVKAAVKLSECDALHFDTTEVEIVGELQLGSTAAFLSLLEETETRRSPAHSATPSRQHSSPAPFASDLAVTPKVYIQPTTSAKPKNRLMATTEVKDRREEFDAKMANLQSTTSHPQGVKNHDVEPDAFKPREGSALLSSSPADASSSPLAKFASTSTPSLPQAEERSSKRQRTEGTVSLDSNQIESRRSKAAGRRHVEVATPKAVPSSPKGGRNRRAARSIDSRTRSRRKRGWDNNNNNDDDDW